MSRLRKRKSLAFLCVALVAFAAFLPTVVSNFPVAILTPLWLVFPAAAIVLVRRKASRCDEQPVSLLSLVGSRAPPSTLTFA